ncbi:ATP-grasp domain-containing protein [Janibacter sp. G349]|uniref:ATP-grasp domain-containing protein n=1 Tax=unclassified Janibacter TaxID=2649294 RepID=UPI003B807B6F
MSSGELFLERLHQNPDVALSIYLTEPVPAAFAAQAAALADRYPDVPQQTAPRVPAAWSESQERNLLAQEWSYVLCAGEPAVEAVDVIRERGGVQPRNATETAGARIDKFLAQDTLRQAGLNHIRSWSLQDSSDLAEIPVPCIVKPANSAGSDGVSLIHTREQLTARMTALLESTNAMGVETSRVVAQEVIHGTEYVVDGYVSTGTPHVASVCRYEKQMQSDSPAYRSLTWLPPTEVPRFDELMTYVQDCLSALGVEVGCFHFEVFDTGTTWVMVEVGLRPHGGGHPRFTEAVNRGVSQVTLECDSVAGNAPQGHQVDLELRGRVVFLAVDRDAVFITDPGAALREVPGVQKAVLAVTTGDRASPPQNLFDTFKIGFVFAVASSFGELNALEQRVRERFRETHTDVAQDERATAQAPAGNS